MSYTPYESQSVQLPIASAPVRTAGRMCDRYGMSEREDLS